MRVAGRRRLRFPRSCFPCEDSPPPHRCLSDGFGFAYDTDGEAISRRYLSKYAGAIIAILNTKRKRRGYSVFGAPFLR